MAPTGPLDCQHSTGHYVKAANLLLRLCTCLKTSSLSLLQSSAKA